MKWKQNFVFVTWINKFNIENFNLFEAVETIHKQVIKFAYFENNCLFIWFKLILNFLYFSFKLDWFHLVVFLYLYHNVRLTFCFIHFEIPVRVQYNFLKRFLFPCVQPISSKWECKLAVAARHVRWELTRYLFRWDFP